MRVNHSPAPEYGAFLDRKAQLAAGDGFEPKDLPEWLFPFQRSLVEWAIHQGRAAVFADCGLGKTPMQLVWADNVRRHTGRPVLIVTPLAVSFQTQAEAHKFGYDAAVSRDGRVAAAITLTNYERLHLFDRDDFGGVVCDESSAIKAFDGQRRALVTEFLRKQRYRLLCTATAAPNDYIELGTSSEALGFLGYMDMLSQFFTNDNKTRYMGVESAWRFKGHAETPFWRWVASWARALRRPSDLGFSDDGFVLPALRQEQHVVVARRPAEGRLFDLPAANLQEEREEMRRTLPERCEKAAALVQGHEISLVFCQLNDEGDTLERLIPNSLQVSGSDSEEYKELAAEWFVGRRCICNEVVFRSKLATWESGARATGKTITLNTVRDGSPRLWPTSNATTNNAASTCANGLHATESMSWRTAEPMPSSATPDDVSDTRPTQQCGNRSGQRSEIGNAPIQTNDLHSGSSLSASLLSNTAPDSLSRVADAPSVRQRLATDVATACTSITATRQDASAAFYARPATSDLESSETIQNDLSAPHCICGYISGRRRLITKPVMFGLGLNFQHCSHVVYFPNHSYEQFYQSVRRCWRFGQLRPVTVDVVTTEGGENALRSLERKAHQADRMFDALVTHMRDALGIRRTDDHVTPVRVPAWV